MSHLDLYELEGNILLFQMPFEEEGGNNFNKGKI